MVSVSGSPPSLTTITSAPVALACGVTDASVTSKYSVRPTVGMTIEAVGVCGTCDIVGASDEPDVPALRSEAAGGVPSIGAQLGRERADEQRVVAQVAL